MISSLTLRARGIRGLIHGFLREELEKKETALRKTFKDDVSSEQFNEKREALEQEYDAEAWISSALAKADSIQIVTHLAKAIYPDAKIKTVSSTFVRPSTLPRLGYVSSAWVNDDIAVDVTGNAAALPIMRLLNLTFESRTLLDLAFSRDEDLTLALHDDRSLASEWIDNIIALTEARTPGPSSHSMMKQVFWPMDTDAANFIILAPLYSSGIAHHTFEKIRSARFGDDVKNARSAQKSGTYSPTVLKEFPNTAVSILGGSNPQNLSLNNSKRGGVNYHLSSLPPLWKSNGPPRYFSPDAVFKAFERRDPVRALIRTLREFLRTSPSATVETRATVSRHLTALADELLAFTVEHHSWEPGWTLDTATQADHWQMLWLDPYRSIENHAFHQNFVQKNWFQMLSKVFASWVNTALHELKLGDAEHSEWRRYLLDSMAWKELLDDTVDTIEQQMIQSESI